MEMNVDLVDIMTEGIVIDIVVTRARTAKVRVWLGMRLLQLAAVLLPCSVDIREVL